MWPNVNLIHISICNNVRIVKVNDMTSLRVVRLPTFGLVSFALVSLCELVKRFGLLIAVQDGRW